MKKKRFVLGEGYYCFGTEYVCPRCFGSEGDWVAIVDRNGKRIKFADRVPRAKTKMKLIVELR